MADIRSGGKGLHHGSDVLQRQLHDWGGERKHFAVTAFPMSPDGYVFDKPATEIAAASRPSEGVPPKVYRDWRFNGMTQAQPESKAVLGVLELRAIREAVLRLDNHHCHAGACMFRRFRLDLDFQAIGRNPAGVAQPTGSGVGAL